MKLIYARTTIAILEEMFSIISVRIFEETNGLVLGKMFRKKIVKLIKKTRKFPGIPKIISGGIPGDFFQRNT